MPARRQRRPKLQTRKILTLAKRDYLATVRTKAFVFGLVIAPILFGGGSIGAALLKGRPDLRDRRIAIVDHTGVVAESILRAAREKNGKELFDKQTGQQIAARFVFEVAAPAGDPNAQLLLLSDRVRRRELAAFLTIGPRALHAPKGADAAKEDAAGGVSYYTNAGGIDETGIWLRGPLEDGIRWTRLTAAGIDAARVKTLTAAAPVNRLGLVERDRRTGAIREARKRSDLANFFVPFAVAMILTMIVMVGSAPMLQAVSQDKSQRIVEMLLGAATPFELMAGKVLGAVCVSVTSSLLYVAGGLLAVNALGLASALPLSIVPWFYVYLLLDVVMLCSFAAALGSACSTPQDAQNLAIVLLTPCLIPMFLLMTVLRQPNGMIATAMSLIPPFTPILMLLRQVLPGGVPAWQPWVGLAGVLCFTLATVWAASRIFRVSILIQGKAPRLPELARLLVKG